jgi:hypothetical protein
MTKAHTPAPAADAPKPDGLDTCLTTATTAAKDLLGDASDNASSDATVTLTTKVVKGGESQASSFSASVGLSRNVGAPVAVPAPDSGTGC